MTKSMTNAVDEEPKTMSKKSPITMSDGKREVRIYTTRNRSRILYQISHNFGGSRERRSFANLQDAKREANLLLNTRNREEAEGMGMSMADIQSYGAARKKLQDLKMPLHVAAEVMVEANRELAGNGTILEAVRFWHRHNASITRKPVLELMEEYIADRLAAKTDPAYHSNIRRNLTLFNEAMGGMMLPDIRTNDIDEWLEKIEWEQVTKKNSRQILVTFSRWAKKRGYLSMENREFEAIRFFRVIQKDALVFTPEEMCKLLEAAGKNPILPLIAIGGFAGMRFMEIHRLDWSEVLWDRGLIEVKGYKSKTRARRLVPMTDNLRAWLGPFARESGPVIAHVRPAAASQKIAGRAGVVWKRNGLRHSFASYRLAATNDAAKTALESGHAQTILFRYYHALVSREQAQAWFSIFPKWYVPAKPKKAAENAQQPQPLRLLPAPDAVAPEIVGDTGLNDEEIRRALLG